MLEQSMTKERCKQLCERRDELFSKRNEESIKRRNQKTIFIYRVLDYLFEHVDDINYSNKSIFKYYLYIPDHVTHKCFCGLKSEMIISYFDNKNIKNKHIKNIENIFNNLKIKFNQMNTGTNMYKKYYMEITFDDFYPKIDSFFYTKESKAIYESREYVKKYISNKKKDSEYKFDIEPIKKIFKEFIEEYKNILRFDIEEGACEYYSYRILTTLSSVFKEINPSEYNIIDYNIRKIIWELIDEKTV